jgi:hypothetical protein
MQTLVDKYNVTPTKTDPTASVGQDLKDAQAAIKSGASKTEVRRRFIESHPSDAKTFDDYLP